MAKLGLLIFNGRSFSLFKYILVSVEHALQYLITVCFGLKLLIMKHLKGGCAEQLGSSYHWGSSENRSPPSPQGARCCSSCGPLGSFAWARQSCFFTALCGLHQKPLTGDGQLFYTCFAADAQPVVGRQVAAGRAQAPAQSMVPNPVPGLGAAGLAHRRQLARRSLSFLCSDQLSLLPPAVSGPPVVSPYPSSLAG